MKRLVFLLSLLTLFAPVELTRLIVITGFKYYPYMMPVFYWELGLIWGGYFATVYLCWLSLRTLAKRSDNGNK